MKITQLFGILIAGLFITLVISIFKNPPINTTVLVQAGHEGRTVGSTGSVNGKYREVDWNILIADKIAEELERNGVNVTRVGANIPIANTRLAVAIHFDGSARPCSTGASIGYNIKHPEATKTALRWKSIYREFFPFKWHRDNFTKNLGHYYGFRRVNSEKGFLVLELGEISCDRQIEWLEPKLDLIALKIANFIMEELDS